MTDPAFALLSPDVGKLDSAALARLAAVEPDHALTLLAEMARATDRSLAELAAGLAARLVIDMARSGPAASAGIGRLASVAADRADGDIDLDRSLDVLIEASASGRVCSLDELFVQRWSKPSMALALVIDRSGSMGGARLATAAVAAAACAQRAPDDWAAIAFSDRAVVLRSLDRPRPTAGVVGDILGLRGYGTTNLAAALIAAREQLARSPARRRVTLLLSDGRPTSGADPTAVARRCDELCVIAPADDAVHAADFASSVGAACAGVAGPNDFPAALAAVLG